MSDPEVCEVATKAIDILNTDGWAQGTFHSRTGGHCILGAIEKATGYWLGFDSWGGSKIDSSKAPLYSKVNQALWDRNRRGPSPVRFNDLTNTTKEDVINLLGKLCND